MMKANQEDFYGSSEAMLDMITDLQSARIDSQRAELRPLAPMADPAPAAEAVPAPTPAPLKSKVKPKLKDTKGASLPGLRYQHTLSAKPEDDFLDMIARVQGSRLEEQRTELPRRKPELERARTVPDEDFFTLLMRAQSGRMEDQRAEIPARNPARDGNNGSSSKK